jgi:hypothetical protein
MLFFTLILLGFTWNLVASLKLHNLRVWTFEPLLFESRTHSSQLITLFWASDVWTIQVRNSI